MKLRITDRVLVALAGLILIACCAGMVAQLFFGVDLVAKAGQIFSTDSTKIRVVLIALSTLLFLLGVYCILVLFRHRRRKDKFILQKTDNGELAISLKALENLVSKCIEQHDELKVQSQHLENQRDGLLIRIRGTVAGGISIPLTVEALQKQIKQYVTACSGVEVKGIQVRIESSGEDAKDAPFAIEAPASRPLLRGADKQSEPEVSASETEPDTATEDSITVPTFKENSKPLTVPIPEEDETDDRPLHQRLFTPKAEPCIVPEPPKAEEVITAAGSDSEALFEEAKEVAAEEHPEFSDGANSGITDQTVVETDEALPIKEETEHE